MHKLLLLTMATLAMLPSQSSQQQLLLLVNLQQAPLIVQQTPFYQYDLMNLYGSCQAADQLIKQGEGLRTKMYYDTMGIPTICYGYNLRNGNARSEVAKAGANYDQVMGGATVSQSVCDNLFNMYYSRYKSAAQGIFGTLKCSAAQAVAVDMTYNLGTGGISAFHNFIANMKAGNWAQAAQDGTNSLWCRQVGYRCSRNMNQIKNCCH